MSLLDNAYNYYESLVLEELDEQLRGQGRDEDFLIDTLCVALNQLPARYFRYGVDMAFYLSTDEYLMMKARVREAVNVAVDRVSRSGRKGQPESSESTRPAQPVPLIRQDLKAEAEPVTGRVRAEADSSAEPPA